MAYIVVVRWILLSRKTSQLNVLGTERGACMQRVWRGSCCDACVRLNTAVHDWMSCSLCCQFKMLWLAHMQPFYGHCKPQPVASSALMLLVGSRKGVQPVKNWVVGCWRRYLSTARSDLHMVQLMPLPPTVSCFSKIQIGFAFPVLAHPSSPGQRAIKWVLFCELHDLPRDLLHGTVSFPFFISPFSSHTLFEDRRLHSGVF